jgi:hypothetical protein
MIASHAWAEAPQHADCKRWEGFGRSGDRSAARLRFPRDDCGRAARVLFADTLGDEGRSNGGAAV